MKVLLLHSFQDYLILAYSFMAAIAAFGYGPQIYTLIKSTGHSISTPITTWLLWTAEASVSLTYAIIVLRDPVTMLVFGVDFLAAFSIVALTIYNRYYRFGAPPKTAKTIKVKAAPSCTSSRESIRLIIQSQIQTSS
jgi:hypothetical protein